MYKRSFISLLCYISLYKSYSEISELLRFKWRIFLTKNRLILSVIKITDKNCHDVSRPTLPARSPLWDSCDSDSDLLCDILIVYLRMTGPAMCVNKVDRTRLR